MEILWEYIHLYARRVMKNANLSVSLGLAVFVISKIPEILAHRNQTCPGQT